MAQVLFVRELAADRDLVLAFASDGSAAWALDRESGLQWWYPGGDRSVVRQAIAEHWDGFATMPITAASYAGPHPALELARRAELSARAAAPPAYGPSKLSTPATRPLVALALLLTMLGVLLATGGGAGTPAVDDPPAAGSTTETAGTRCAVRGDVAHDVAGHLLVCVPASRALSSELAWRAAT